MAISHLAAHEGDAVWVLGESHTVKLRHTAYTVIEAAGVPGSGLPPHAVESQDQSVYVLDGAYALVGGDDHLLLTAGSFAFIPRGTVHRLTVAGADPARCLLTVNPPGVVETFLDEVRAAQAVTSAGSDGAIRGDSQGVATADEIYTIARRVGISMLTSPV